MEELHARGHGRIDPAALFRPGRTGQRPAPAGSGCGGRGRQEPLLTNEVVDNRLAFAAIEVGGTAVSIRASYRFHRYGHHRLERWTSILHASLATSGAVRNDRRKTAPPSTPS